jgi:membrane protease YdiL (CAAX protease family)
MRTKANTDEIKNNKKNKTGNKEKKVTATQIYFSTIYNKLFYIVMSLSMAVMLDIISTVSTDTNITIIYWICIIIYSIIIFLIYEISKIIKKHKGKLEVKKVSTKYIALRILFTIIYTIIASMLVTIISIVYTIQTLKG